MSNKDRVKKFLFENFYVPEAEEIDESGSLVVAGIIDSTGVLELVQFLEDEFGIRVEDSELLPENLDSIENIERFLNKKLEPVNIP